MFCATPHYRLKGLHHGPITIHRRWATWQNEEIVSGPTAKQFACSMLRIIVSRCLTEAKRRFALFHGQNVLWEAQLIVGVCMGCFVCDSILWAMQPVRISDAMGSMRSQTCCSSTFQRKLGFATVTEHWWIDCHGRCDDIQPVFNGAHCFFEMPTCA